MENPYAPVYSDLSDEQKAKVNDIKEEAFTLFKTICEPVKDVECDPRNESMSKSYLEIAVMLAVKSVTNPKTAIPQSN